MSRKKINDHIHQCIIVAYQRYCSPSNNYQSIYRLTSGEKEFCINFDEIYYFETSENIHKVILHAQNQILEFQAKLKEIEPELDKRFCRCHRSFIINTDKISDINLKERTITLTNDDIVLASKQVSRNFSLLVKYQNIRCHKNYNINNHGYQK